MNIVFWRDRPEVGLLSMFECFQALKTHKTRSRIHVHFFFLNVEAMAQAWSLNMKMNNVFWRDRPEVGLLSMFECFRALKTHKTRSGIYVFFFFLNVEAMARA